MAKTRQVGKLTPHSKRRIGGRTAEVLIDEAGNLFTINPSSRNITFLGTEASKARAPMADVAKGVAPSEAAGGLKRAPWNPKMGRGVVEGTQELVGLLESAENLTPEEKKAGFENVMSKITGQGAIKGENSLGALGSLGGVGQDWRPDLGKEAGVYGGIPEDITGIMESLRPANPDTGMEGTEPGEGIKFQIPDWRKKYPYNPPPSPPRGPWEENPWEWGPDGWYRPGPGSGPVPLPSPYPYPRPERPEGPRWPSEPAPMPQPYFPPEGGRPDRPMPLPLRPEGPRWPSPGDPSRSPFYGNPNMRLLNEEVLHDSLNKLGQVRKLLGNFKG